MIAVAPVDYRDLAAFPTAKALAADICAAHAAGAALVHFHVTDATGKATADTTFFDDVVARVRDRCDIIIEGSTGGVGVPWEVRTAALNARGIELASLNMGTCNLFGRAYVNTPEEIATLAQRMRTAGVTPDMCFFEPGFFTSLELLGPRASSPEQPIVAGVCLGFPGALPATVANLVFMVSQLPPGAVWTLVHHGHRDHALLAAAIAAGGGIRVGFEDSRALGAGREARNNADLVRHARRLVEHLGRPIAPPAEVRKLCGLRDQPRRHK